MALIALLAAAAFVAQPARLVLGKDAAAELTLRAPANAKVTLTTSVGSIGEPSHEGEQWKARFTAPALHAPSVALVLAQWEEDGERELRWLSIPLSGSDTMEIETRPGSTVEADVAGAKIGPVTADHAGIARLPMVVPPGVQTASLRITDKLGNVNEKSISLDPPPFSRVRIAARAESATAAAPLEVEIFVVRPDGTPDDHAKLELTPDEGEVEVGKRTGPGIYLGQYTPPPGKAGAGRLEARVNGQPVSLEVPVRAAKVRIAQPFWPSALAAQRPWSVSLGLVGGGGATYDGAGAGALALEAAMRIEVLPLEAVLQAGGSTFSELTQGVGPGTTNATPHSWLLQGGVRAGTRLMRGVDGHVTVLAGAQDQVVHVRSVTSPPVDNHSWNPHAALALGANLRLGPGRALAQVQFDSGATGVAGLTGSVGSVQLQLGYLVTVY